MIVDPPRHKKCHHGYVCSMKPLQYALTGWLQPYAENCPICNGKPAGIPFRRPETADRHYPGGPRK